MDKERRTSNGLDQKSEVETLARIAFDKVDLDKDGYVSEKEIGFLMQTATGSFQKPTKQEVREAFIYLDENKDGKVSFEEFLKLINELQGQDDS